MSKLIEFQKKVQAIKKDGKNPHFKSNYATLTQILSEVKPILSELNLALLQPIKDGKVYSIIIDEKNVVLFDSAIDLPTGLNPQQIGSAITYYRRYTLASLLSLELEDDDGNAASEVKPTAKAPEQEKPWLNIDTPTYKEAVAHLKGGGKIPDIEAKFRLSRAVKEALLKDGFGQQH